MSDARARTAHADNQVGLVLDALDGALECTNQVVLTEERLGFLPMTALSSDAGFALAAETGRRDEPDSMAGRCGRPVSCDGVQDGVARRNARPADGRMKPARRPVVGQLDAIDSASEAVGVFRVDLFENKPRIDVTERDDLRPVSNGLNGPMFLVSERRAVVTELGIQLLGRIALQATGLRSFFSRPLLHERVGHWNRNRLRQSHDCEYRPGRKPRLLLL